MRTKLLILLLTAAAAFGADLNGKWTASIETPIGTQNYTYTFQVDGEKLTGSANSQMSESKITEGKVTGDEISFVETMKFQDMEIKVTYKGKVAGDEIKLTRNVGEFATEELTAKRAK